MGPVANWNTFLESDFLATLVFVTFWGSVLSSPVLLIAGRPGSKLRAARRPALLHLIGSPLLGIGIGFLFIVHGSDGFSSKILDSLIGSPSQSSPLWNLVALIYGMLAGYYLSTTLLFAAVVRRLGLQHPTTR